MKKYLDPAHAETIEYESVGIEKRQEYAVLNRHNRATIAPREAMSKVGFVLLELSKFALLAPYRILKIGVSGLVAPKEDWQRREVKRKEVSPSKLAQWEREERETARQKNISITVKTEVNVKVSQ